MAKSINITIPEREIMKAKTKQGVYRSQPIMPGQTITTAIIPVIEKMFREYAKRHGCKPSMENTEWARFKSVMDKYL